MIVAVGIGPGSLELLTGEARAVLAAADVVVGYKPYVELVAPLIGHAQVEATGMRQEVDRCRRALDLHREGIFRPGDTRCRLRSGKCEQGDDPGFCPFLNLSVDL